MLPAGKYGFLSIFSMTTEIDFFFLTTSKINLTEKESVYLKKYLAYKKL